MFCGPSCVFTNVVNPRAFVESKAISAHACAAPREHRRKCHHCLRRYDRRLCADRRRRRRHAGRARLRTGGWRSRPTRWVGEPSGRDIGTRSRLPCDRRALRSDVAGVLSPSARHGLKNGRPRAYREINPIRADRQPRGQAVRIASQVFRIKRSVCARKSTRASPASSTMASSSSGQKSPSWNDA